MSPVSSEDKPESDAVLSSDQILAIERKVDERLSKELKKYWGIGLFVVGAFGALTIFQVFLKVKDFVKWETDKLIAKTDTETGVRATLDNLVNRAIVVSALIELQQSTTSSAPPRSATVQGNPPAATRAAAGTFGPPPWRGLRYDQWTRLELWLQDKDLGDQNFLDTLDVLTAQEQERIDHDARAFLAEMLDPAVGTRWRWTLNQPSKRLAIIKAFDQRSLPGLEAAALRVVGETNAPEEVRLAAIDYLEHMQYQPAASELLGETSDDRKLHLRAFTAVAWITPFEPQIIREVKDIMGRSAPCGDDIAEAVNLARNLWFSPPVPGENRQEPSQENVFNSRLEISSALLGYAFRHDAYLDALSSDMMGIFVATPESRLAAVKVPISDFKVFRPYWQLLTDASNSGDLDAVRREGPISCRWKDLQALTVTLQQSAKIQVGGAEIDARHTEPIVLVTSVDENNGKPKPLRAVVQGAAAPSPITALRGRGFVFALPVPFQAEDCLHLQPVPKD